MVAATIIVIALLALLLIGITVSKYAIHNHFLRTRFIMSALFIFIVCTLSISFWDSTAITIPFTVPALIGGMVLGYFIGVRTERQKIMTQGLDRYMQRFEKVETADIQHLTWWSVVNYYSIMVGLILINLVGFTNVILHGSPLFIIITSSVGAAFVGSIVPYLAHLWSIPLKKERE